MGKRSGFTRIARDFYPTPREAVDPLLPHLHPATRFCEPCAGDGRLVDYLTSHSHVCARAWDIEPRRSGIERNDALTTRVGNIDCFITNPPWSRAFLHPLIAFLSDQAPTWLLFDADWPHTKQAAPYLSRLRRIVAVGRLKWIEDSPFTGKDNCCWYLFGLPSGEPVHFYGRCASIQHATP